ncbi:MAG: zinc ribbon domain-containing protein [Clostridia bacterium]|nr:zinc ribbon domain-containing protein [Clostridia bacterium]
MKSCQFCNQPIEQAALFCPYCGQKQETAEVSAPVQTDERESAFYVFRRNLRHERKCWSIFGKVWLGFCIFFAALPLLFFILAAATESPELIFMGVAYGFYPLLLLPVAIVNLVMSRKITGYLNTLETDPNPAVDRCGGIWLIVLSALFNNIALIFVILNFIHVKTHKELLMK